MAEAVLVAMAVAAVIWAWRKFRASEDLVVDAERHWRRQIIKAREARDQADQGRDRLRRIAMHLAETVCLAEIQRNELQDAAVEYRRCPKCESPVAMSGGVCLAGECRFCGEVVGETDMGEAVDPLDVIRDLQAGSQAGSQAGPQAR